MRLYILGCLVFAGAARAHVAAFHKAMYCLNGTVSGLDNQNNDAPVSPLWQLTKKDYWFHHVNGCDQFPPAPGDFLDLPAGGSFPVELATNRAFTSLSFGGKYSSSWLNGGNFPSDYSQQNPGTSVFPPSGCITTPNIHTQNQSMAAGTAFAISYESDLSQVTIENLAVFTVRYNTPWQRDTSYDVPAAMPPCPPGGCTCAWVWIPNGCGEPNIYMQGFKCRVTGSTSNTAIAPAKPATWCEGNPAACVKGSKQIMIWQQAEGNNVDVTGYDLSGSPKSPAYNNKMGWADGAQNDIFLPSSQSNSNPPGSSSSQISRSFSPQTSASSIMSNGAGSPPHSYKPKPSSSACRTNYKRDHYRRNANYDY